MFRTRLRQPLRRLGVVWLVIAVAVLGAMAPAVSHAVASANNATPMMMNLCVSAEPNPMSTDFPAGQEFALSSEHCPFCLLHTDRVAPPPHVLPYLFSVQDGFREPTVRQAFFFFTRFSPAPAPRGPPATV